MTDRFARAGRVRILLILLLALSLRLGFAFSSSDEALMAGDGEEYFDLSANLAAGRGFSISTYRYYEPAPALGEASELHADLHRSPVLPLLGAALLFLPGDWSTWARLLVAGIGASTVWLFFVLARRIFDVRAALWAALLFALHPFAIFYSARWLTEGAFIAALLLFLVALAEGESRSSPSTSRLGFLTGAALGLAILTRPTAVTLVPLTWIWYWVRRPQPTANSPQHSTAHRRSTFRTSTAFLLGVALLIGPWAIRNYVHTGVPNPLTFVGPYNVWLGTNDWQYEIYRADTAIDLHTAIDGLYFEGARNHVRAMERAGVTNVVAVNRYWLARSLEYARAEPAKMAFILGRRVLHYFQPTTQQGATDESLRIVSGVWMLVLYGLVLSALFLRSPQIRRSGSNVDRSLLLLLPVAGFLSAMPFVFALRYRFPFFDPILVLVAAATIPVWIDRISLELRRRSARP